MTPDELSDLTPEQIKKYMHEFADSAIAGEMVEHMAGCRMCQKLQEKLGELVEWHMKQVNKLR